MKAIITLALCVLVAQVSMAQVVFSDTDATSIPDSIDVSAEVKILSAGYNKGFLLPLLPHNKMNGIFEPAKGLLIYNVEKKEPMFYASSLWNYFTKIPSEAASNVLGEVQFMGTEKKLRFLGNSNTWHILSVGANL